MIEHPVLVFTGRQVSRRIQLYRRANRHGLGVEERHAGLRQEHTTRTDDRTRAVGLLVEGEELDAWGERRGLVTDISRPGHTRREESAIR